MADQFFPTNFDVAPVMTLDATLYTIRATIFNPDTSVNMQLPDHVWLLVDVSGKTPLAVARSTPSDSTGTCALGLPLPIVAGNFSLLFFPAPSIVNTSLPDAALIRSGYLQEREAWIDLDKPNVWAVPPPPVTLETRRLLRMPAWSSTRKAPLGGFKVVPPKATKFAAQGTIPFAELEVFGPWDLPLDHKWIRAKLEFSFSDWQQNQSESLPPGLILEARRTIKAAPGTVRVGAGVSASLKDGSSYLLLEGDQKVWKDCHFQFRTPGACFIDLSSKATPKPDTRLSNGTPPKRLDDFNQLPVDWHSLGMRASFTTSPPATGASPPAPAGPTSARSADKLFEGLRFDLAKVKDGDNASIAFHLDDVVLTDPIGKPINKNRTAPLTLLDHLLAVITPDPQAPYQTVIKRVGLIVPGSDAYSLPATTGAGAPPAYAQMTRLIHFEGGLHDLRNDRVTTSVGKLGTLPCIGARAALLGSHGISKVQNPTATPFSGVDLGLQLHLIDVPDVADPATGTPLMHLLLYVPMRIDAPGALNPASSVADAKKLLNDAAELWSPGHPGSNSATKAKRYALIPNAQANRKNIIIRIRTFFAESKAAPKLIIRLTNDKTPKRNDRSNTAAGTTGGARTRVILFDSAVQTDKNASLSPPTTPPGAPEGDAGDGVSSPFLTLTHELGHGVHGLMDEYVEVLDTEKDPGIKIAHGDPVLPSFGQFDEGFSDWRPYYSDTASLMNANHVPRLRHYWNHLKNFDAAKNGDGRFALPDAPFDLVHETFKTRAGVINPGAIADPGTSLTYSVPPNNTVAPWPPVFKDLKIPGGFGQVALFALGADEGAVEGMFQTLLGGPGLPVEGRMQGVLLIRTRICFIFDTKMTPQERLDALQQDFHAKIYQQNYAPKIRFLLVPNLVGGVKPRIPRGIDRIAVLFQPLYSVDAKEIPKADLVFDILKPASPPLANPFLTKITVQRTKVTTTDFTFESVMRLVLGVPTFLPGGTAPDVGVLRATDLDPTVRAVETALRETPNFRQVSVFP